MRLQDHAITAAKLVDGAIHGTHPYAGSPMQMNAKTPRGLLETADQLQSTLTRINSTAERIRGVLFGFAPECDDCFNSPSSLDDILNLSLRLAEEVEKTLIGIGSRITND